MSHRDLYRVCYYSYKYITVNLNNIIHKVYNATAKETVFVFYLQAFRKKKMSMFTVVMFLFCFVLFVCLFVFVSYGISISFPCICHSYHE